MTMIETSLADGTTVRITSPAPRAVWRTVFGRAPDAVATQAPEWMDALGTRGYRDASRLYELDDGRRLVLPLAARRVAGLTLTEESWPYGWGYGGLLAEGGGLTDADCRLVLDDLARRPAVLRAVVPMPLHGARWAAAAPGTVRRVPYTCQVVDLDGGFDTVWSTRFRRQARNSVRKAERFGLDVQREHAGMSHGRGLEMFAQLYAGAVDRWAAQRGQPLRIARLLAARRDRPGQLAAAAAALGDRCVIWSACHRGEPVAVNVVLQGARHAVGWLCAMQPELARETLATYLLHSLTISDACRAGVRHFHMGESETGSGAEHFKRYFGATPVEYAALRFERLPLSRAEQRLRAGYAAVSRRGLRRSEESGTR
ncbi:GNAT family N-acetyltransferase [Pseudonocardia hispaniensis]|uniref:GNAT family N-acetyltransferase n=1 Tax=Pseudonocardia hispaniensis TaxID=904933 RepID=A0ABW1IZ63_9PSEU